MFDPGPCVYMEKLAGGPDVADVLSLDVPLGEVIGRATTIEPSEAAGTDLEQDVGAGVECQSKGEKQISHGSRDQEDAQGRRS